MDQKKPLLHLFILVLLFSCLFSLGSPQTRKQKAGRNQDPKGVRWTPNMRYEVLTKNIYKEEDVLVNGRMDFEINDYPGSGANSRHDPKTPGKP